MSAELFNRFRENISVKNADDISTSYSEITKCLNKYFWNSNSETAHRRQVGSYGRQTAIHGISDLDMAFELPLEVYQKYHSYQSNGQSALLQEVKRALKDRYPLKDIKGDGQVVIIPYQKYTVELLPVFLDTNGDYIHPDSNEGGKWKTTKPKKEIDAITNLNQQKGRNLKRLCKMIRAWKNHHGVNMGGILIDTLCYNFLNQTTVYDTATYSSYKNLVFDFFKYLSDQNEEQTSWRAPGSNQAVWKKGNFHTKAKKAMNLCSDALADEPNAYKHWKSVFGRNFPKPLKEEAVKKSFTFRDTEQFIEDYFPVDIRYEINLDCRIQEENTLLRSLLIKAGLGYKIPKQRRLNFFIESHNIPKPFSLKWKVLNIGKVAEQKNMIRGEITDDSGALEKTEHSSFEGEHFVECYAIKNGVCVARASITVPIA
ncbi:SMODS domain-containing nucleotidyltransferase [Chromobacterium violaceum]|uniref:SMODS domain-containing nucleotidyltransferase n=1 Tax=Chromobacterium violaceum TaxID=536 RepID=UPI001B32182C|nr:nucleotidyltransferase [Chromobacterium violaceum]MBP4047105.1 hypothetical protein [Chromobacterium violaceum]